MKQRWGKLTDDDLTVLSGKKEELVGKLQERYGYSKEKAQKEADEWAAASSHDWSETTGATATHEVGSSRKF